MVVMYAPTRVAVCWSTLPSRRSAWSCWKCANAAVEAIGFSSSSPWLWNDTCTNESSEPKNDVAHVARLGIRELVKDPFDSSLVLVGRLGRPHRITGYQSLLHRFAP